MILLAISWTLAPRKQYISHLHPDILDYGASYDHSREVGWHGKSAGCGGVTNTPRFLLLRGRQACFRGAGVTARGKAGSCSSKALNLLACGMSQDDKMEQGLFLLCLLLWTVVPGSICWETELTGAFGLAPSLLQESPAGDGAGRPNANQGFRELFVFFNPIKDRYSLF